MQFSDKITFYYKTKEVAPISELPIVEIGKGPWCWTILGYELIKNHLPNCQFITGPLFPEKGIVFAHVKHIPRMLPPHPGRYIFAFRADKHGSYDYNFEITQDYSMIHQHRLARAIHPQDYLPHFPEKHILKSISKGKRFCRIAFLGAEENLAPELKSLDFREFLKENDCSLVEVYEPSRWMDYTDYDAVLAVRNFSGSLIRNKPPSKLINAWLAGVIPILGKESEFRRVGNRGTDYVEIDGYEDLKRAIQTLKTDNKLRMAILDAGRAKADIYSYDAISRIWVDRFRDVFIPYARSHKNYRHFFFQMGLRLLFGQIIKYSPTGITPKRQTPSPVDEYRGVVWREFKRQCLLKLGIK